MHAETLGFIIIFSLLPPVRPTCLWGFHLLYIQIRQIGVGLDIFLSGDSSVAVDVSFTLAPTRL